MTEQSQYANHEVESDPSSHSRPQDPTQSVFDVIGPVITGCSSSHTYAPMKLGLMFHRLGRSLNAEIEDVHVSLFGSFASIERDMGDLDPHGTKHGIAAGLLGRTPGEPIRDALVEFAKPIAFDAKTKPESRSLIDIRVGFRLPTLGYFQAKATAESIGGGSLVLERPTDAVRKGG